LADRYMYLPMIGLILAGVWSACDGIHYAFLDRWRGRPVILKIAGGIAAGMLLISLGLLTSKQVQVWSSSEQLWQHARSLDGRNFRASFNLAQLRIVDQKYRGAIRYLEEAEEVAPGSLAIQRSLGLVNLRLARFDDADRHLRKALTQMPNDAELHYSLALVAIERRNWKQATKLMNRARALAPSNPRYRASAGNLKTRGKQEQN
jgi:Flp pilus assembly protein TadD